MVLQTCTIRNQGIELKWEDGIPRFYPFLWLWENSRHPEMWDSNTRQRLQSLGDAPQPLPSPKVEQTEQKLLLHWPQHTSAYPLEWLRQNGHAKRQFWALPTKTWRAVEVQDLPGFDWEEVQGSAKNSFAALDHFFRTGWLLLRGLATKSGAVLGVAEHFGYVRETNYGRLFDVRAEPSPSHLAYTSRPLALHTDNAYRHAPPSVQLLHCLSNIGPGGDSLLVDGFAVLERLLEEDSGAFQTLARVPIPHRHRSAQIELFYEQPLLRLDYEGKPEAIFFNERTAAPLQTSPHDMLELYGAYTHFIRLSREPEFTFEYHMEPGDCLILNNHRILHGRTGFSVEAGVRHLQGCYSDIDQFLSNYRILEARLSNGLDSSPSPHRESSSPVA